MEVEVIIGNWWEMVFISICISYDGFKFYKNNVFEILVYMFKCFYLIKIEFLFIFCEG